MARLEAYICENCDNEVEEIFNDTETRPDYLDEVCAKCGGRMKKSSIKNNSHRVYIQDRPM